MNNSRKTIFDLERRCDLKEEFEQIISDLKATSIGDTVINSRKVFPLLDDSIRTWPYRQGATSIDSFARSHGFLCSKDYSDQEMLFYLELLVNLLYWAPTYDQSLQNPYELDFGPPLLKMQCTRCIENIEYILEMLNMRVRKINMECTPQYVISKRDSQVDAVIEAVPELSEALLSYLDVRNQKDEDAKKAVLKAIADYLEDRHRSKYYKGTMYASLEDNLFTVFNKVGIRHGDKKQWMLRKPARMKLYDQTFKAAIHLLQMEDVKTFNDTVSDLKKKQEELVGTTGNNSN